ncbi:MAG: hypothetical protein ACI8P3_002797 [Saprospiraceae bacterium]
MLHPPESFNENLKSIAETAEIKITARKTDKIEFLILFAIHQAEMNEIVANTFPQLIGDAMVWVAYPKKSSKKYKTDFNRDSGWEIMGQFEMEGVRMVAIDEDWSALRFRKVDYIKTMKRKFGTLSEKGAKKVKK